MEESFTVPSEKPVPKLGSRNRKMASKINKGRSSKSSASVMQHNVGDGPRRSGEGSRKRGSGGQLRGGKDYKGWLKSPYIEDYDEDDVYSNMSKGIFMNVFREGAVTVRKTKAPAGSHNDYLVQVVKSSEVPRSEKDADKKRYTPACGITPPLLCLGSSATGVGRIGLDQQYPPDSIGFGLTRSCGIMVSTSCSVMRSLIARSIRIRPMRY